MTERQEQDRAEVLNSPYVRILLAARNGRGIRLSAEECWSLSLDDAIETRAGDLLESIGLMFFDGNLEKMR